MPDQTIGGLFADNQRAERALAELGRADFTNAQISEVANDDEVAQANGVARGGVLVTVKAGARASEAVAILERFGADLGLQRDRTIELRAERLAIDKVRVASGSVQIRKNVVWEQQKIDVPVSHEQLVIERRTVTGGVAGGTIGHEKTIIISLARDEVQVGKTTVVTEEIDVGKRAVTATHRVTETVRHEELIVARVDHLNDTRTSS